jgi:phosphatidylethanolamine/phosphatidyl-N-methylethanolamine N-methyltransferase
MGLMLQAHSPSSADIMAHPEGSVADAFVRLRLLEKLLFLVEFAHHPRLTGAIAPSSRRLARAMVDNMGLEAAGEVVELGAGTGVFTSVIAELLPDSARFMAVEINPRMAASLRKAFANEVNVVCDSAAHLSRHLNGSAAGGVDAIVSSLPWVSFPEETQERILHEIHSALRPGGRFSTFAYPHAAWLPSGRKFRRRLEVIFARTEVTPVVWKNLPPAVVLRCEK